MSYRVEYEPMTKRKKASDRFGLRQIWLTVLCFLLFLQLVHSFWPGGKEVLQEALWPGDPVITRQAAEDFVAALRYGEPLGEAVQGFCREILQGANIGG